MLDELRKIPLFADLSEEDLEQLHKMAETVSIPAGQLVLREGDPGDSLYVLLDGELEVTKRQGSQDILLAVYKPGQFFGALEDPAHGDLQVAQHRIDADPERKDGRPRYARRRPCARAEQSGRRRTE